MPDWVAPNAAAVAAPGMSGWLSSVAPGVSFSTSRPSTYMRPGAIVRSVPAAFSPRAKPPTAAPVGGAVTG